MRDVYARDHRRLQPAARRGAAGRLMKVAIRDDDTCYFTAPARLERVYASLGSRAGVPCDDSARDGLQESGSAGSLLASRAKRFRSSAIAEMVAALRELTAAGRVTIALHGYTHEDFPDG